MQSRETDKPAQARPEDMADSGSLWDVSGPPGLFQALADSRVSCVCERETVCICERVCAVWGCV